MELFLYFKLVGQDEFLQHILLGQQRFHDFPDTGDTPYSILSASNHPLKNPGKPSEGLLPALPPGKEIFTVSGEKRGPMLLLHGGKIVRCPGKILEQALGG